MSVDLYDTLGVPKDASEAQVKKAYRKKAAKAHPDAGGDADEFRKLTGAYLVLRDPARRDRYDRTGDDGLASEVDRVRQGAVSMLGALVAQSLENEFAAERDLLAAIRAQLKHETGQLKAAMSAHSDRRKRVEANGKRWKRKKGAEGPDMLAAIILGQITSIAHTIAQCEEQIEIRAAVVEMLDAYEYEFVSPPRHEQYQNLGMFIRGGTSGNTW